MVAGSMVTERSVVLDTEASAISDYFDAYLKDLCVCVSFCGRISLKKKFKEVKMVTRVRNQGAFPYLQTEGQIVKPMPRVGPHVIGAAWYKNLSCFDRLFGYQTLSSTRRYAYFKPYPGLIPQDALDFCLASSYDHEKEVFADKVDVVLQRESLNQDTWRRLRNTRDIKPEKDAISAAAAVAYGHKMSLRRYNDYHPVFIGGISERRHPSNVKLMNSSHHSPQTNAGYSRQDSDGNSYQY